MKVGAGDGIPVANNVTSQPRATRPSVMLLATVSQAPYCRGGVRQATGDRIATRLPGIVMVWHYPDPHAGLKRSPCSTVIRRDTGPLWGTRDRASNPADTATCDLATASPRDGSYPRQPAPGKYTSAQACMYESSPPAAAHSYPLTNLAAIPIARQTSQNRTARSRQDPSAGLSVCSAGQGGAVGTDQLADGLKHLLIQGRQEGKRVPLCAGGDRLRITAHPFSHARIVPVWS